MMSAGRVFGLLLLCGTAALSQRLLSARAGTVNWLRGSVFIDGARAILRPSHLLVLKNGQTLRTERGRVEVLLGERVFLRMIEGSALRMEDNHMDDARLSLESGSAVVEVVQVTKGASLKLRCGDLTTELKNAGVYRFDSAPCALRVYRGDASVTTGQTVLRARNAQAVNLSAELVSSFDTKQSDPLSTWSDQRSQQRIARERRMQEARAMVRARRKLQMDENSQ